MLQRILVNFGLALEGINANKLRSLLTALGIIFGVGAVIAMLAIGSGAKQSILDQMKLIGTNNIIIEGKTTISTEEEAVEETAEEQQQQQDAKRPFSPGLTLEDVEAIEQVLPTVEKTSPEVVITANVIGAGKLRKTRCVGITNTFFELNQIGLGRGEWFHESHLEHGRPVCIIGRNVQTRFFGKDDPIGQKIKAGNTWMTIIGVLEKRIVTKDKLENLGIRDYNDDIYVPISTMLLRFDNRAKITNDDISSRGRRSSAPPGNHNQLDRVVIRVTESSKLQATADVIARMLKRRHHNLVDFEIQVPELLLAQQQKTQETFNFVLAVIAGISLLVGGIGIMNIMLASVLERIKEIGVRRSLGANRQDIVLQFLFEAIVISLIGGLVGVLGGILAARTIASYADIPTVVSLWSVLLSFGVAASIGLVFGLFPAQKAANQDPIKALRSD